MPANALLKEYFLNTVADDYENIEMLREQIGQWPEEYQRVFSEEALIEAINETIEENVAQAYKYNPKTNTYEQCALDVNGIENLWFLAS